MKKTTIELDDFVYRELKIRAAERGITMKEFVETAVKAALLTNQDQPKQQMRVRFPIIESTDPNHQITSEDVSRILNELDEEEALEYARFIRR